MPSAGQHVSYRCQNVILKKERNYNCPRVRSQFYDVIEWRLCRDTPPPGVFLGDAVGYIFENHAASIPVTWTDVASDDASSASRFGLVASCMPFAAFETTGAGSTVHHRKIVCAWTVTRISEEGVESMGISCIWQGSTVHTLITRREETWM